MAKQNKTLNEDFTASMASELYQKEVLSNLCQVLSTNSKDCEDFFLRLKHLINTLDRLGCQETEKVVIIAPDHKIKDSFMKYASINGLAYYHTDQYYNFCLNSCVLNLSRFLFSIINSCIYFHESWANSFHNISYLNSEYVKLFSNFAEVETYVLEEDSSNVMTDAHNMIGRDGELSECFMISSDKNRAIYFAREVYKLFEEYERNKLKNSIPLGLVEELKQLASTYKKYSDSNFTESVFSALMFRLKSVTIKNLVDVINTLEHNLTAPRLVLGTHKEFKELLENFNFDMPGFSHVYIILPKEKDSEYIADIQKITSDFGKMIKNTSYTLEFVSLDD